MKKPEPHRLMAYLYGELKPEEAKKIRQALENFPELKQEFVELKRTRSLLEQDEEEAVPAPQFILPSPQAPTAKNLRLTRIKPRLAWAAAFLLLLAMGYWMNLRASWQDQQLVLRFGKGAGQEEQKRWEAAQNQFQLVKNELDSLKHWMLLRETNQTELLDSTLHTIAARLRNQGKQLQNLSKQPSDTPDSQTLLSILESQQNQWITEIVRQVSQQYQEFNEDNLSNLVLYLENQREEDLQNIFATLQILQLNQENQDLEQNEILDEILISLYKKQKNHE